VDSADALLTRAAHVEPNRAEVWRTIWRRLRASWAAIVIQHWCLLAGFKRSLDSLNAAFSLTHQ
jgi:hypothetical protein